VGEQVTLPCRVENAVGKLQWTRDDFGLGLGRDLTGFDRYGGFSDVIVFFVTS
jgi:hypothetical protein